MELKIILTESELRVLIMDVYLDGFTYGKIIDKEQKNAKNWSSKGRDTIEYARNKSKQILKELKWAR